MSKGAGWILQRKLPLRWGVFPSDTGHKKTQEVFSNWETADLAMKNP